ncbi:MAG: hypothetical protein WC343_05130 [Bacilli bacterium]|jgi:hypothetical protein
MANNIEPTTSTQDFSVPLEIQHRIEIKVSNLVFNQMKAEKDALKYTWSQYITLVWFGAHHLKPEIYDKYEDMQPDSKVLDRVYLS